MKISELKLGQKAKITYIGPEVVDAYSFKGEVKVHPKDGELWLTPDGIHGYGLNSKFNDLWKVEIL